MEEEKSKRIIQKSFEILFSDLKESIEKYNEVKTEEEKEASLDKVNAYLISTVHLIGDYIERYAEEFSRDEVLAFKYANNIAKHVGMFETYVSSKVGFSVPFKLPLTPELVLIWKFDSSLPVHHQDQKEAFKNFLAGKKILPTIDEIAKTILSSNNN